jgi:TRAP-type C4-dicarboxylate transport system permease small subunit
MLVGVAALAMFPYCQLHRGHAAVDIFMQKAPGWANRIVEVLSAILMAAVAMTMAIMLVQGTLEVRGDNVETAVLGWPVWVFMPAAVVSCILWSLAAIMPLLNDAEVSDGT